MKLLPNAIAGLLLGFVISSSGTEVAQSLKIPGIENTFRVAEKIYSGSQPDGDAAFAELAKLGVKTIVSVDGAKPDIEASRKHGLRYVHLPISYDGIPTNRVAELAKLSATKETIFVHCHHGQHRGPAAVAVICLASKNWTTNHAEAWMRQAGTSDDYPGLYRAARDFKTPSQSQLVSVEEFPEVAQASPIVDAMVKIDGHFDRLKKSQKNGWKNTVDITRLQLDHESTQLGEQLRELSRTDTVMRPEDYRTKLHQAERSVENLRLLLRQRADSTALNLAFKQSSESCAACHRTYRDD